MSTIGLQFVLSGDLRLIFKWERFVLTFLGNFFKFVDIGSVAQAVEQRTFNA